MKPAKRLFAVLLLLLVSNMGATANWSNDSTAVVWYAWPFQEAREKIKKEELPAAAAKHVDDNYKGWTFVQAYRVKAQDKEEYEVELKKDSQTQTLKFDKEGNLKK
jgi:hypothetical protein